MCLWLVTLLSIIQLLLTKYVKEYPLLSNLIYMNGFFVKDGMNYESWTLQQIQKNDIRPSNNFC